MTSDSFRAGPRPRVFLFLLLLGLAGLLGALGACRPGRVPAPGAADRVGPVAWPPGAATPRPPPAVPTGPLRLSVAEAVLMALEQNRDFQIDRLGPAIARTREAEARAAFDPTLTAGLDGGVTRSASSTSRDFGLSAGVGATLPGGTEVELGLSGDRSWSAGGSDAHSAQLELSVTQALLRGAGRSVNLAALRQARLDVRSSAYELRGLAEALVATVETAYWDCVLARQRIEIYRDSLALAEKQLAEVGERITLGKLAGIERAAAQAEVAQRRSDLIDAHSRLASADLRLARLLSPADGLAGRELLCAETPAPPTPEPAELEARLLLARRLRPDLNQARLALASGELDVVRTRNGLLPRLDLFISLGKTGYAGAVGEAWSDLFDGSRGSFSAGLSFSLPLGNRAAAAGYQRAVLGRRQAAEALGNLEDLVELDVRLAAIEVERTRALITSTAATRQYREATLRAETEKFNADKSTSLLVAQAQRDLVASRIAESEAAIGHLKALVALYRLEGSLLERRGIVAPGREPAESAVRPAPPVPELRLVPAIPAEPATPLPPPSVAPPATPTPSAAPGA